MNQYPTIPFLVVNGLLGWCLLWSTSEIIFGSIIGRVFVYLGKRSIYILVGHFLCFKFITKIYILINKLPNYMLAAFPTLKVGGLWIFYTLIGVAIPVIVGGTLIQACNILKKPKSVP